MLNPEYIRELEITEVEQCRGRLTWRGKFCAFGLGAKMLGYEVENGCVDGYVSGLPIHTLKQLGVTDPNQIIIWNDGDLLSFQEIAKELRNVE